jgi:hypothetical protein
MADAPRRANMQDYRNFPLYLTADLWNVLESTETTTSQLRKIELLCNYLVSSLGLRHASEPTQSVLVALVGRRMEALQQSALLQTIKSVLRTTCTRARHSGTPLPGNVYLEQLPAGLDDLPEAFRTHVATLGISAVPAGVNLEEIWQSARATPVRSRNQQLVLQQAVHGRAPQGVASLQCMQVFQQQLATQTATMMAHAVVGALQPRDQELPLRNLHVFARQTETGAAAPRAAGLEQLMLRAQTPGASLAALQVERRSEPVLALANGPAQGGGSTEESAAALENGVAAPEIQPGEVPAGALPAASGAVPNAAFAAADGAAVAAAAAAETPEPPTEIPSQVAATVQSLAKAHYEKALPDSGKGKGKGLKKSLKRPSAVRQTPLKRPAAAQAPAVEKTREHDEPAKSSTATSAKKRPASAAGGKASKKRPAAAGSAEGGLKPLSEKERFKLQPHGCPTCRGRPGCCRSCWAKRGFHVQ